MSTTGGSPEPQVRASDWEASLVDCLHDLAELNAQHFDIEAIKMSVRRGFRIPSDDVWEPVQVAAADLGLRINCVRIKPQDVLRELRRGPILCFGEEGWCLLEEPFSDGVLLRSRGNSVELKGHAWLRWVTGPTVEPTLGSALNDERVLCGFVQVAAAAGPQPGSSGKKPYDTL